MEFQTVVGTVFLEEGDFVENEKELHKTFYTLAAEDGTFYPLKFKTSEQAAKVKINALIAISIATEKDADGEYLVSTDEKFFTVLTEYAPSMVSASDGGSDRPKIVVAIWRSVNPTTLETKGGEESEWYAEEWEKVRRAAADVQGWYSQHYGNYIDWDVQGFCVITDKIAGRSYYLEDVITEHKKKDELIFGTDVKWKDYFYHKDNNPEGWNYKWHHAWSGRSTSICGWGRVGYSGSMTYQSCSRGWITMCHELGHNFGLRHSQTVSGEGDEAIVKEYGDASCNMGRSTLGHNIVQHEIFLRRHASPMPDSLKARLSSTDARYIVLVPQEIDDCALHPGEVKYISSGGYTFGMRDTKSNPFASDKYNDINSKIAVYTFSDDTVAGPQGSNRGKAQRRGNLTDKYNTGTGVLEVVDEVFKNEWGTYGKKLLKFVGNNASESDLGPRPEVSMGFPPVLDGAHLSEKHDGLWYNPKYNGQGFDFLVKDGMLDFMFYTYSRNDPVGDGKPPLQYFKASCSVEDAVKGFDIVQPLGGEWADTSEVKEEHIGRGQLYFYDDNRGVFLYDTERYGYGALELVKLMNRHPSGQNGVYHDPTLPHHEVRVNMFTEDRLIAFFQTFDQPTRNYYKETGDPYSEQHWFLMYGTYGTDEKGSYYECKVMETSMGKGFSTQPYETHEIGTAKLRFRDNNKTLWFSVNYLPLGKYATRRTKTFKMERK